MSQLILTAINRQFTMNVTGFNSPIYGSISSAQTSTEAVYFPVKMSQPDIEFDVQFASVADFTSFSYFVRYHQVAAQLTTTPVTLYWPERNINNFSGLIQKFQAGGAKALYAPTARFTVSLIQSTVSTRTIVASIANPWFTVYGIGMVNGILDEPSGANSSLVLNTIGESIVNTGSTSVANAPGITTGS